LPTLHVFLEPSCSAGNHHARIARLRGNAKIVKKGGTLMGSKKKSKSKKKKLQLVEAPQNGTPQEPQEKEEKQEREHDETEEED
jgi:hypothetical protein